MSKEKRKIVVIAVTAGVAIFIFIIWLFIVPTYFIKRPESGAPSFSKEVGEPLKDIKEQFGQLNQSLRAVGEQRDLKN